CARLRQSSAAARLRRADRQPRSGHVGGDHAVALPHQPLGDDDPDGDARPRDGGQDAPPRNRARGRTARARRAPWRLRVVTRLKTVLTESLRSLGANMSTTLAAAVTVLIGMFLLGLFIALWSWAHSYDHQLKNQLAVRVYFCTSSTCPQGASAAEENAVARRFNGDSRIKNIIPVSKEEALALMKKREPKAVEVLPANPFPDALKIYPKSGDLTPTIGKEIQDANLPGVQTVDWGGKLTKHVLHVTHVIETFFIAAAMKNVSITCVTCRTCFVSFPPQSTVCTPGRFAS